jgi:hypothetical protein
MGDGQIIWSDAANIFRCPISGCDSMPAKYPVGVISSNWNVYPVTADESGFYWWQTASFGAFSGSLKKCPLCGCSGTVINAVEKQRGGSDIASDGTNVFWLGASDTSGEVVYTCDAARCATTVQAVPDTNSGYDLHDLVKHGPYLYSFESHYPSDSLRRWPPASSSTVKIGGTLTGLPVGTSITLRQGSDDLTRTADGPFTFPTPMATGSLFSAYVTAHPMGRTCRITGASGWVGAADVTSVVVNCALDTSTVGGEVSGVLGETIVLQNNGADSITMSATGYFAFPAPLARGSAYNVTVSTQPAFDGPCTVSLGSGTTASGATVDVTNVTINCVRRQSGPRSGGLSTDGQYLYWVQGGTGAVPDSGISYTNGAAVRMPLAGGPVEVLASALDNIGVGSTAVDTNFLYFSARTAGTIYRVPLAGGAVRPLVVGETSPTSLAVSGTTLYWANASHIMSLDLMSDAGVPVPIAPSPVAGLFEFSPRRLIIGNGQLYWVKPTDNIDETVERAGLRGENRVTLTLQHEWLTGGIGLAGSKVFFTGATTQLMSISQ